MNSARGTRTVRLQRKQGGLDFSVKGGREHGIPVVVSWIKENGAASKKVGGAGPHGVKDSICFCAYSLIVEARR